MSDQRTTDRRSSKKESKNEPSEKPAAASARRSQRSWVREYFEALLIAGIFLGFSNTFVVKTFFIPSSSMEDTLLIGDHLFVNRLIYGQSQGLDGALPNRDLERGDVVVFRSPENPSIDLVKRCMGIPGDRIRIRNKQLLINGDLVDDSAFVEHRDPTTIPDSEAFSRRSRQRDHFDGFVVPEDHYFFLGDNRDYSYDSRFWGAVPRHYIKGRALMVYWSYGGQTPDGDWPGYGAKIAQVGGTLWGFFTKTRWDRTFHLIE